MNYANLIIISFVLLLPCISSAQDKEIKGQATIMPPVGQSEVGATIFLDINFSEGINIYDKPNGKVITTTQNSVEKEDFVLFDLLHKTDSLFYVVAYHSLDESTIAKGWILKNKRLGIYSRAYDAENHPLVLYECPDDTSQIVAKKAYYDPVMYEVVDFEGKWLKIRAIINDITYQGWIPPEMQCSNVYSTCS